MLSYHKLKDRPRDLLAATGLTLEEFQQLLPAFQGAYTKRYPNELTRAGQPRQRRGGGGAKGVLHSCEDNLLCILVSQKTQPLHTRHALQVDVSQPHAPDWMHQLLPVLQHAWADLGLAPERDASRLATSPLILDGAPETALAGTERRRQRPTDARLHKAQYSGQKTAPTAKNILLVNEMTGKVVYLGPTEPGKMHAKKAADEAKMTYSRHATLDKDTGFQGDAPEGVLTQQPKKSPQARSCAWGTSSSITSSPVSASSWKT